MSERLDRFIKNTFHTIAGKITAAFVIMGAMLIVALLFVLSDTLNRQEENLMSLKEETDIQYVGDYISPGGTWQVRDGMLCKGFVDVGNGLKNKALIWPFGIGTENRHFLLHFCAYGCCGSGGIG